MRARACRGRCSGWLAKWTHLVQNGDDLTLANGEFSIFAHTFEIVKYFPLYRVGLYRVNGHINPMTMRVGKRRTHYGIMDPKTVGGCLATCDIFFSGRPPRPTTADTPSFNNCTRPIIIVTIDTGLPYGFELETNIYTRANL